jgi:hypothetical protein
MPNTAILAGDEEVWADAAGKSIQVNRPMLFRKYLIPLVQMFDGPPPPHSPQ